MVPAAARAASADRSECGAPICAFARFVIVAVAEHGDRSTRREGHRRLPPTHRRVDLVEGGRHHDQIEGFRDKRPVLERGGVDPGPVVRGDLRAELDGGHPVAR